MIARYDPPQSLPGVVRCERHDRAGTVKAGWRCPLCASSGAAVAEGVEAGKAVLSARRVATARRGHATETAMYELLQGEGWCDLSLGQQPAPDAWRFAFVPGLAWGWHLEPRRGYASDFGFPFARVLLEVDGNAHAVTHGKVKADTERRGLAGSAGWIVVAVTPDQVQDRSALELVRRPLTPGAASP